MPRFPFLHKIARATAMRLPPIRRLYDDRESLRLRLKEAEQKYLAATPWGRPSYDSDYLRVWFRNTDFLKDERFMNAYRAGVYSGHKIGLPTRTSQDIHIEWRILVCCWAAWHAMQLAGDFVECGTNTGIMSLAICHYIDFNTTGKDFYLFDTFSGIPVEQMLPEELALGRQAENAAYEECFDLAGRNFSAFPRAHLVRGKVPETLESAPIEKVCYLMLDMNIMIPERAALAYFWDKLVSGAIVLFDDYGWSGYVAQKNAHDEFAASKGVKILNLPTGQGMLIKL